MPSDSTKTLVDFCEEVSFHVGRVKNPRFLFPAKKAVDVRREVVCDTTTKIIFGEDIGIANKGHMSHS
jgi:hypothetical protein